MGTIKNSVGRNRTPLPLNFRRRKKCLNINYKSKIPLSHKSNLMGSFLVYREMIFKFPFTRRIKCRIFFCTKSTIHTSILHMLIKSMKRFIRVINIELDIILFLLSKEIRSKRLF